MAELLLVSNPKSRRKSRKGRMPAGLRKYWAAKRAGKSGGKKRRRARASRRRRSNPRRHHRRAARKAMVTRRKRNPHRRRSRARHRRRNPSLRNLTAQFMPTFEAGAWGAGGGLALDVIWGLFTTNLPSVAAYLSNPYLTLLGKLGASVGLGAFGGHLLKGKGRVLAEGAATVTLHDFMKGQLLTLAPTIFGPGGPLAFGAYMSGAAPDYFGAYLSGAAPIMGTATIPQSYLPFSGSSGMADGNMYTDDRMGMDPWS
jgi:hypothetical protein